MKYIKLFEDINTDGYEEILYYEYSYTLDNKDILYFTQEEVEILGRFGLMLEESDYDQRVLLWKLVLAKRSKSHGKSGIAEQIKEDLHVYKLPDEWYHISDCISTPNKYYKCDQLDGLINCLTVLLTKEPKKNIFTRIKNYLSK